eukprot:10586106-Alexandrium_andersonii.AAC.1
MCIRDSSSSSSGKSCAGGHSPNARWAKATRAARLRLPTQAPHASPRSMLCLLYTSPSPRD